MNNYLLYTVMGVSIVISISLLIAFILLIFRYQKLYRAYDLFMRGKAAESLEGTITELKLQLQDLKSEDRANKDAIRGLNRNQRSSYQKFGIVKYNAFKGMGGNLSFVIALLDYTNSGFVLNSVHSKEGCFIYVKIVDHGQTEVLLGSEEREALEQALGYVERQPDI